MEFIIDEFKMKGVEGIKIHKVTCDCGEETKKEQNYFICKCGKVYKPGVVECADGPEKEWAKTLIK